MKIHTNISSSSSSSNSNSSCYTFGKPHETLQQYDCYSKDLTSLLKRLPVSENPFTNWTSSSSLSPHPSSDDVTTWFPNDTHVVFHPRPSTTPEENVDGNEMMAKNKQSPLTYQGLHELIATCPPYYDHRMVVAVVLPQATMMAEMAVVLLSLFASKKVCVAPLDSNMHPRHKLVDAMKQLGCQGIVTTQDIYDASIANSEDLDTILCDIRIIESNNDAVNKVGSIRWKIVKEKTDDDAGDEFDDVSLKEDSAEGERPILLLRTSGTTSIPKIVPLTASSLLYNATCIATSLKLTRQDISCNAMPLFHIGGIACSLLSVFVSGSSTIMMGSRSRSGSSSEESSAAFNPETFLDTITSTAAATAPTWYYGVPSMHKTLLLTAKARLLHTSSASSFGTSLRFIRSGAAHLPHEVAIELAKVFNTTVIPTYSMSECMPVCSSHYTPVVVVGEKNDNDTSVIPNSVGQPIGCSVRIVNELGNALPYGTIGEVTLHGPGVMKQYLGGDNGLSSSLSSHTEDGWLRTGDIGQLDTNGNLTLKGRSKEMIKRGGDQVWPNEVDNVVQNIQGVAQAVTFGVPNDLWGEEVAVAVVADYDCYNGDQEALRQSIMEECKNELDTSAVPSQIVFVPSTEHLLRSATGKYLRTKLAEHLNVKPVDTRALRLMEEMAGSSGGSNNDATSNTKKQVVPMVPSSALNGVRFVAACFVVQGHLGIYPNLAWLKIQNFSFNMTIFFMLGGFQLVCATKSSVHKNWAEWVGTKIGTMHALFVVCQIIALPAYILFQCGPNGYIETYLNSDEDGEYAEDEDGGDDTITPGTTTCQERLSYYIPLFILNTVTGMVPRYDAVIPPSWFQTAFYMFLMIFPYLDAHLRTKSFGGLLWRLILNLSIASIFFVFFYRLWILNYLILGWLPALVSSMIAGYYFTRYASSSSDVDSKDTTTTTNRIKSFLQNPTVYGIIADVLSLIFIGLEVVNVTSTSDCVYLEKDDLLEMRPNEPLPTNGHMLIDNIEIYHVCDVTYDEFVEFVGAGGFSTTFSDIIGHLRAGSPLVLLWLYALAYGKGYTARVLNHRYIQWLSPLAYPIYLLHIPLARYYWIVTRGHQAEEWWDVAIGIPIEWYEVFLIIVICIVVGFIIDRTIVSFLTRYTVSVGVAVCKFISRFCCCCCSFCKQQDQTNTTSGAAGTSSSSPSSPITNLQRVRGVVQRITGQSNEDELSLITNLRDLGLDSLGTTALLGTLRSSIPIARKLTLRQLLTLETVGDLVHTLDTLEEEQNEKEKVKEGSRTTTTTKKQKTKKRNNKNDTKEDEEIGGRRNNTSKDDDCGVELGGEQTWHHEYEESSSF